MKPLPQDTQHVRGSGIRTKVAALNCRRTHLGAGVLLTRHPSAVLWPPGDEQASKRGGQLAVLWKRGQRAQQSGAADVWLEGNRALRGKPDVGLPCSVQERCVCAPVYFWHFCGTKQGGKGLQTFWAERSCLSPLRCSFLRRAEWPPTSYLPPPSYGYQILHW